MKKSLLVAALFAAFSSTSAMAADTATINATANVLATCKFVQNQGTLAFGTLDGKSMVNATASTTLSYECTNGTQSIVSLNNGVAFSDLKNADQTSLIRYTLTTVGENQVGQGFVGHELQYVVNANIAYDAYKDAKAGEHTDTIFVSIAE